MSDATIDAPSVPLANRKRLDPRLLAGEQLVPHRLELLQRRPNLVLGQVGRLGPRCLPGADDDLRLSDQRPHLRHHHRLDLGRGDAPHDGGVHHHLAWRCR